MPIVVSIGSGEQEVIAASQLSPVLSVPSLRAAATIDELRGVTGDATYLRALRLLGHSTVGDGGHGDVVWTDDTSTADNGGAVFVPTSGPRTGCWKRPPEDEVRAAWFGVGCDGPLRPYRARLQAAMDYASSLRLGTNLYQGFSGKDAIATLRLPSGGCYLIDGDQPLVAPPNIRIAGSYTYLFSESVTAPIMLADGFVLDVEGVGFAGGNGHIKVTGINPMANGMRITFRDCIFNETKTGEHSTVLDAVDPEWGEHLSAKVHFVGCLHDGCLALKGGADDITIEHGVASWPVGMGPWLDVRSGNTRISDIQGVPMWMVIDESTGARQWVPSAVANPWIKLSNGSLDCTGFRFGGEYGGAQILAYSGTPGDYSSFVRFTACEMFSAWGPWATFDGDMPSVELSTNQAYCPQAAWVDAAAEASISRPGRRLSYSHRTDGINPMMVRDSDQTEIESLSELRNAT